MFYRNKKHFSLMVLVCLLLISSIGKALSEPIPQLGMNLAGPADWNTELPFVDVFRMSRSWISQQKDKSWGKGPELDLDEHGWIRRLEPDCWAETLMCTIEGGHYPSGRYAIFYDGKGKLGVWNAGTIVSDEPGRLIVELDASKGAFFLRLLETDPNDYIRNIRVIMPGFEDTYKTNPWHPVFLNRWKGMACLRFMDFMHTNNSRIAHWSQRPTLQDATFSQKGIALELLIDLCNRLGADPWFCMPHLADDEYIRNFAQMVKSQLDPSRKIVVEYSNEVWNGMFQQSKFAGQEGIKLGFAEKSWEAAWRYTAYRSVQVFRIWEQVFGGSERLVRILPSQAANPYVSERVVEWQDAYKHADALAIAPYISMNLSPGGKPDAKQVANWSVEQVLDYLENKALPESIKWIQDSKKIADKYGLKLMTYEGGQHMVGVGGGENIEQLTELLHKANAHPRMADIYAKYYAAWEDAGGDLFCYFSSVSKWSKWGSWGLLQYYDEDPAQSPKFMPTMQWARKCNQAVNLPGTKK
ncbi:MAG: hypothetical protein JXA82_05960 [Sedimentisphaerales bacterium]|nr:hypothetical protein [Sedimentisphaerales bacterium]